MPRVALFEIMAEDPQRAIAFYTSVFGWKIEKVKDRDYWSVDTTFNNEAGITGGIMPRRADDSSKGAGAYVCSIEVPNFDEYSAKIAAAGGQILSQKLEIHGVRTYGYFRDTENNVFGLTQSTQTT